ncbi:MAG TPA: hypothetical protein VEM40_09015 [Nitrospirota bacterium]|nr:hypothetical protein [Nitrospirota bacterium]
MLINKGGHWVSKGTYWDLRRGRRIDIADEGALPGGETSTYLRMPSGVMLLLGPIIGLLYAILLPIIGIVTVAALAVYKILGGLYDLAAKSISFGWTPKSAYLSGKKKKKQDTK